MNPSGSDVPFAFPPEDCVTIKCERVQRNAFVAPKHQIIGARSVISKSVLSVPMLMIPVQVTEII